MQITNNTTIDGTANNIVIDGNNAYQLFYVHTNAVLVLKNIQLWNGLSTNGGAIFNQGALIISNSIFAGNSAVNASGVNGLNATTNSGTNGTAASPGGGALGGAIYSQGPVSVFYSLFGTNTARAGSGGNGGNGSSGNATGNGGNGGAGAGAFGGAVMSTGSSNVFLATEFIGNSCVAGAGGSGGAGGVGVLLHPQRQLRPGRRRRRGGGRRPLRDRIALHVQLPLFHQHCHRRRQRGGSAQWGFQR